MLEDGLGIQRDRGKSLEPNINLKKPLGISEIVRGC